MIEAEDTTKDPIEVNGLMCSSPGGKTYFFNPDGTIEIINQDDQS